MSEEINFDDIEFGEPIEEREPTYRDGYIRGIYRARNIIDSKQKEIERLSKNNTILENKLNMIKENIETIDKKTIIEIIDNYTGFWGSDKE